MPPIRRSEFIALAAAARTICRIDFASPPPRRTSAGWCQLKHRPRLFAKVCSGRTSATRRRRARASQPASAAKPSASWRQPCSTTTSGASAGSRGGA